MELVQNENEKYIEFDETDLELLNQFKMLEAQMHLLNDKIAELASLEVSKKIETISALQARVLGNTQWCWLEISKKFKKRGISLDVDLNAAMFDNLTNRVLLDATRQDALTIQPILSTDQTPKEVTEALKSLIDATGGVQ